MTPSSESAPNPGNESTAIGGGGTASRSGGAGLRQDASISNPNKTTVIATGLGTAVDLSAHTPA